MFHLRKEKLLRSQSAAATAGPLDDPKFDVNPECDTITCVFCLHAILFNAWWLS